MKKIILIVFLMLLCIFLVSASNPVYYDILLNYNNGNVEIKNVNITVSQYNPENFNEDGNYSIKILDINNKKLFENNFYIPNIIIEDYVDEYRNITGIEKILDNVDFELYAPYYSNAKEIVIYDTDKKEIARKDISVFSREKPKNQIIGGDKDKHGCLIGAGYSWCEEKQKCLRTWEEQCSSNGGNVQKNNENLYNYLIIFLVIVIAVYVILHLKDKKEKKHHRR